VSFQVLFLFVGHKLPRVILLWDFTCSVCGVSLLGPCKTVTKSGLTTDWGPSLGAVSVDGLKALVESEAAVAKPDQVSATL
jgi:hypothetical protein